MDAVWPNTIVEENNIQVHLSALRKILGADRDLILTVPGRGYQLVQRHRAASIAASSPRHNARRSDAPLRRCARQLVEARSGRRSRSARCWPIRAC